MEAALVFHRLQFAFTLVYHYLFPQLTMGLALLIVIMKALGLREGGERWNDAARFWIRIFGINFAVGVVTGIPMEFQFGTNWARFSRHAGSVIGQTLAMEGLFAFFLESSFLFLLVWGERRLSKIGHFFTAVALFVGSWVSGYFIIATNAFMQYPVGHGVRADGTLQLVDFWAFVLSPWALVQYAHNMVAAVVTGSFVVAAVGAYYTLTGRHLPTAGVFLRLGVTAALVASVLVSVTGDRQAKLVARHQPVALAAMEGRFETGAQGPLSFGGQRCEVRRPFLHCPVVENVTRFAVKIVGGPIWRDVGAMPPDRADLHPAHRLPDILSIGDFSLSDHRLAVGRHHFTRNGRTLPKNFRTDPSQDRERNHENRDEDQPKPSHSLSFCLQVSGAPAWLQHRRRWRAWRLEITWEPPTGPCLQDKRRHCAQRGWAGHPTVACAALENCQWGFARHIPLRSHPRRLP